MIPNFASPVTRPNFAASGWGDSRAYRGEGKKHEGIDFRAAIGDPVFAVGDGKVITSKNGAPDPAGEFISIQHAGGFITRYMHLSARLAKVGDVVHQGQLIGRAGTSGMQHPEPHLHFDIKLKPSDLANYTSVKGVPSTGFFPESFGSIGVPAEALVPVDQWAKGVRERAIQNNIPLYVAGGGLIGYGLLLGFGYLLLKG